MPDPTFLLIGGQKCGTTWMARMLAQHPDIFVPERKELDFFDRPEELRRGLDWYRSQFSGAGRESCIGECTPNYLGIGRVPDYAISASAPYPISYSPHPEVHHDIAPIVAHHYPDIRLLVMLRNPTDRAVSSYHHQMAMRRISPRCPFSEAAGRLGIVSMGFYAHHLQRWLEHYDRDQLHVMVYEEDLTQRPDAMLADVFAHLGVDPGFAPSGVAARHGQRVSRGALFLRYYSPRVGRRLVRRVPAIGRLPLPSTTVTPEERRRLDALYAPDVAALEQLLGRSLDCWRAATPVT
jgi:hypothetical protein